MSGVEAGVRVRMRKPGPGKPALEVSSDPLRREPAPLAAPFQHTPPVSPRALGIVAEPPRARHRVVLVEPGQHAPEPRPHLRYRFVHPRSKRVLDLLQLRFDGGLVAAAARLEVR